MPRRIIIIEECPCEDECSELWDKEPEVVPNNPYRYKPRIRYDPYPYPRNPLPPLYGPGGVTTGYRPPGVIYS